MLQNHLRREQLNRTRYGLSFLAALLTALALYGGFVEWRPEPLAAADRRLIGGTLAAPFVLFGLGYLLCVLRFRWAAQLWHELRAYGDPTRFLGQIDAELADNRNTFMRGRLPRFSELDRPHCLILSKSWLIYLTDRDCVVLHLPDLLAVSCRRYLNYTANLRRKLRLEFHLRLRSDRLRVLASTSERWMNDLMAELPERCPQALAGLQVDWRQMSAESLEAAVDQRASAVAVLSDSEHERWIEEQKFNLNQFDDQKAIGKRLEPLRQCLRRELRLRWLIGALLLSALAIGPLAYAAMPDLPFDNPKPVLVTLLVLIGPAIYYFLRLFRWSLLTSLPRELRKNGDPDAVLTLIDAELTNPVRCRQWGSLWEWIDGLQSQCLIVTASWVLLLAPRRCTVVQLDEIVWIFQQYRGGSLVAGNDRVFGDVRCQLANGRDVIFRLKNRYWADEFIDELLQRRPGLLTGHQSQWLELAAAGPDALRQEVARRAAEFDQLPARRRRDWLVDRHREFRKTAHRLEPGTA